MSSNALKLSGNVFLCADLHFRHSNIIKYCSRPFANIDEMDEWLIDNTNNTVGEKDTLINVGDFLFPGREDYYTLAKQYRQRIKCKNIYFVWGNHDHRPNPDLIMQSFYNMQNIDSHISKPVKDLSLEQLQYIVEELRRVQDDSYKIRNLNFQKLFKGCYDVLEVEINRKRAVCGHYSYRIWNKSHHGVLHLFGHSHFSLPDDPDALSMDVGVDAAANYLAVDGVLKKENYRPLSWAEILNHMAKKNFKPIDHHGR